MNNPYHISGNFIPNSPEARRSRSTLITIISVVVGIVVSLALLTGFLIWRKWHEEKITYRQQVDDFLRQPQARMGTPSLPGSALPARTALPAKVQVFVDEPVRKGPQAIISGTVQNISGSNLTNLKVELELSHRKDAGTEIRTLEVVPGELGPDQSGKYSLTLIGDYRSVKLVRVKTGTSSDEIGFQSAPGARRPVERAPQTTRTIIINRPSAPPKGEIFINTPDNPAKIP